MCIGGEGLFTFLARVARVIIVGKNLTYFSTSRVKV